MHGGPPPQASHGVMPVQAAGIFLSGFSRTRSIGCPSDVQEGAKSYLQASLMPDFAPSCPPSERLPACNNSVIND